MKTRKYLSQILQNQLSFVLIASQFHFKANIFHNLFPFATLNRTEAYYSSHSAFIKTQKRWMYLLTFTPSITIISLCTLTKFKVSLNPPRKIFLKFFHVYNLYKYSKSKLILDLATLNPSTELHDHKIKPEIKLGQKFSSSLMLFFL